ADVQHVQGEYATRELVESLITQTCVNIAGPGELVLVYFVGHAFLDERNAEVYLAFAYTRYEQPSTCVHLLALARQTMGRGSAAYMPISSTRSASNNAHNSLDKSAIPWFWLVICPLPFPRSKAVLCPNSKAGRCHQLFRLACPPPRLPNL